MVERRIIAIAADPDNDDDGGDESTGKMIPHLCAAKRNVAQQLMAILNYDFQVPLLRNNLLLPEEETPISLYHFVSCRRSVSSLVIAFKMISLCIKYFTMRTYFISLAEPKGSIISEINLIKISLFNSSCQF